MQDSWQAIKAFWALISWTDRAKIACTGSDITTQLLPEYFELKANISIKWGLEIHFHFINYNEKSFFIRALKEKNGVILT